MFKKILIANRGEIACRILRTCRDLGVSTVAVYSDADRDALHVRLADEAVHVGPSPSRESYLNMERILAAARATGAEAIHPGYGFLSEKAEFSEACRSAGIVFVGPPPAAIDAMGEKTRARAHMTAAGVPVVPGTPALEEAELVAAAEAVGYPVMLKAASGGGGKGMRIVRSQAELLDAFRGARRTALSAFGDERVYIERYVENPRHIEIQVLADAHGNAVYLFERECSVQRRHQKIVEEAPASRLSEETRQRMGAIAVQAAKAIGYVNAGTCEFIVDQAENAFFLEMNTRLQVEHPVTEWITGVDLVAEQLHIASGGVLRFEQSQLVRRGHAVECRVYAEDPFRENLPSPGRITLYRAPEGPGVRVDGGVYEGFEVPQHYDSMIAKLAVWGPDRATAIARSLRALSEYRVGGIRTNIPLLETILSTPEFVEGHYDTGLLERMPLPTPEPPAHLAGWLEAAAAWLGATEGPNEPSAPPSPTPSAWRSTVRPGWSGGSR